MPITSFPEFLQPACKRAYDAVGKEAGLSATELSRNGFCRELTHALLGELPDEADAVWELHEGSAGYHFYVGLGESQENQIIADLCAWQFDMRPVRGAGPVLGGRNDVIARLRGAVSEDCLGLYSLGSLFDRGSYRS